MPGGAFCLLQQDEFATDAQFHAARRVGTCRHGPGRDPLRAALPLGRIVQALQTRIGTVDTLGQVQALVHGIRLFAVMLHGFPFARGDKSSVGIAIYARERYLDAVHA